MLVLQMMAAEMQPELRIKSTDGSFKESRRLEYDGIVVDTDIEAVSRSKTSANTEGPIDSE